MDILFVLIKGGDAMPTVIKPQPKQEQFLSSSADL